MSTSDAGPSRPRKTSTSSLTSPSRTKFRDSNERVNLYASTSTLRAANAYDSDEHRDGRHSRDSHVGRSGRDLRSDEDDDEDDLPGYSAPSMGNSANGVDRGYQDIDADRKDDLEGEYSGEQPLLSGQHRGSGPGARRREADQDSRMAGSVHSLAGSTVSMSIAQRKAKWWRDTLITGIFVGSWYGFATLLSIYNKWMFSAEYYNFPYPLFVTACHMVVQFVIASLIRVTMPDRFRPPEKPTRRDYAGKIFPTALSTAGDIGLSNLSLRTITLSLYTMCKSSALIFVLIFAFIFQLERYSLRLLSVISLISVGVFFMVYDTTSVNIPGIVMVFSASALAGLRWALTETLMKRRNMGMSNPFATIFWLAPLMGLVLAPVSLGVEGWGNVFGSGHWDGLWQAMGTGLVIVFPGGLAFAMVASEYFIIDRAGILPLSIAGVFKEVSTISISAWVFGDQLTRLNIVGVVIAVCGIALYSFHKYQKSILDPELAHGHGHGHSQSGSHRPTAPHANGGAYALAASDVEADERGTATPHTYPPGSPDDLDLSATTSNTNTNTGTKAPHPQLEEGSQDRVNRLRDEFEGWNNADGADGDGDGDGEYEETDSEAGEDEVVKRREERVGSGSGLGVGQGAGKGRGRWGSWWDREVW